MERGTKVKENASHAFLENRTQRSKEYETVKELIFKIKSIQGAMVKNLPNLTNKQIKQNQKKIEKWVSPDHQSNNTRIILDEAYSLSRALRNEEKKLEKTLLAKGLFIQKNLGDQQGQSFQMVEDSSNLIEMSLISDIYQSEVELVDLQSYKFKFQRMPNFEVVRNSSLDTLVNTTGWPKKYFLPLFHKYNQGQDRLLKGPSGLLDGTPNRNNKIKPKSMITAFSDMLAECCQSKPGFYENDDLLIACKDRGNVLITKSRRKWFGDLYVFKDGKVSLKLPKKHIKYSETFFAVLFVSNKKLKIESYFLMSETNLYEIYLSQNKAWISKVFPPQSAQNIDKNSKMTSRMRYSESKNSIFVLFPHKNGINYIQGAQLKSEGERYYGLYPRIPPKGVTLDHQIIWFDFIGGDPFKILAITEDHHFCLIETTKDYTSLISEFSELSFMSDDKNENLEIETSGPFCLSSDGEFLIAKINNDFDVIYRVEASQENSKALELKYLEKLKLIKSSEDRSFYFNFDECDEDELEKDSAILGGTLSVKFISADGDLFRILGWSVETGSELRVLGEGRCFSKVEKFDRVLTVSPVGKSSFYACTWSGCVIFVDVSEEK